MSSILGSQHPPLQLELISHACFIAQCISKKLICDPWLNGKVFNNGWELKREIDINHILDLDIDYVYLTHEHPDHFHVPSLKALNDSWDPTFLVQKTHDRRVFNFIKNVLGTRVIELSDGEEFRISSQMSIRIYSHGHMDSFSLLSLGKCTILNINDCVLKTRESLRYLSNRLPASTKVDILMSQYSFASYQGNKSQVEQIASAAQQHLDWISQREHFFKPIMFIPFASGINWCSAENSFLNDFSVKYEDALSAITQSLTPDDHSPTNINGVVVYRTPHDSVRTLSNSVSVTSEVASTISMENFEKELFDISQLLKEERRRLNKDNLHCVLPLMFFAGKLSALKPIKINLELDGVAFKTVFLCPGLRLYLDQPSFHNNYSEISMSLDSFQFCISNRFGAETLWVNSRFHVVSGGAKDFFIHFYPSILSNQGFNFPFGYMRFAWERVITPKLISLSAKVFFRLKAAL